MSSLNRRPTHPPGFDLSSAEGAPAALKALLVEATLLHHHVVAASRSLLDTGDLTNAQVSLLRSIAAAGPQTVPELASARAIARQPVQRMADQLAAAGLLAFAPNPRHKRSHLLALTAAGRRRLDAMERRQDALVEPLAEHLSPKRLLAAARTLRRVRAEITQRVPIRGRRP